MKEFVAEIKLYIPCDYDEHYDIAEFIQKILAPFVKIQKIDKALINSQEEEI